MSKIIRQFSQSGSVVIGEQLRDKEAEARSEITLGKLFPDVTYITAVDGSKLIPITEVRKIEQELRRRMESATKQGFATGYESGKSVGEEQSRAVVRSLEGAINDVIGHRNQFFEEARAKILELVIQISRKVTYDAIQVDREATALMISKVISQLVDRSRICIKVHPDFVPIMEGHRQRFLGESTAIKDLRIEADSRVRAGGCLIETPTGDIDARLEPQFEVIASALRDIDES